jgi:hypothetical protein
MMLSDEGLAAVLWRMKHEIDLEDFDASAPAPQTKALGDMAKEGEDDVDAWIREYREDPVSLLSKHGATRSVAKSASPAKRRRTVQRQT